MPNTYFEQRARRKGSALVTNCARSASAGANFNSITTVGTAGERRFLDSRVKLAALVGQETMARLLPRRTVNHGPVENTIAPV